MRLIGWEQELSDIIEGARFTKYELGTHDCFSFACSVVKALTGKDHWPEFVGHYKTREEAIDLIRSMGRNFEEAFDGFGFDRIERKLATRGDLASYQTPNGDKHLAICLGEQCVGLGPEGLVFLPMRRASTVWRVDA